jgi:hypothetical protein
MGISYTVFANYGLYDAARGERLRMAEGDLVTLGQVIAR